MVTIAELMFRTAEIKSDQESLKKYRELSAEINAEFSNIIKRNISLRDSC